MHEVNRVRQAVTSVGGGMAGFRSMVAPARHVPAVATQARRMRRDVPHLPDAEGRNGIATTVSSGPRVPDRHSLDPESPHAYHLVVLGDSVAAGVGVDHHRNSVAGRLASMLSERCGHPVAWHVSARSGADARAVEALTHLDEGRFTTCDAVVISVGVNDVIGPRTATTWRRDLTALLTRVTTLNPEAPVVLVGVPPLNLFPTMPNELGAFLGRRAERFDAIGREVCDRFPTVHHLPLIDPSLPLKKAFADDGFHPSAKTHKRIAKRADEIMQHAREARELAGDTAPHRPRGAAGSVA